MHMWVQRGVGGYDGIYCTNTRLSTMKSSSGSSYLVLARIPLLRDREPLREPMNVGGRGVLVCDVFAHLGLGRRHSCEHTSSLRLSYPSVERDPPRHSAR